MGGRAPVAMNGAAMSAAGSNVTTGERPGSPASRMRSYSWRADSGLSRSDCICQVVSLQARWSATRVSLNSGAPLRTTATRSSPAGRATTRAASPCEAKTPRTSSASASRTWTTAPSSSAKSAAASSSSLAQSASASIDHARAAGEGHLAQGHEQPAVGAVVIRQDAPAAA